MEFTELSCREFAQLLASKQPVPGGGGAAALVGAVGTALGRMTGALAEGKKKYAQYAEELSFLQSKAEALQEELLQLIETDAQAFAPLAEAYRLPKDTDEEKQYKLLVMEKALTGASLPPLHIMEKCAAALEIIEIMAVKGSRLAVSDAASGALFCLAAMQAAALNVYINTKLMQNRAQAQQLNRRAQNLLNEYRPRAEAIYNSTLHDLTAY
ncbi:MAG: cyclodeaminase/cyclohydrolase family protein [Candidatus Bruticola sp.]